MAGFFKNLYNKVSNRADVDWDELEAELPGDTVVVRSGGEMEDEGGRVHSGFERSRLGSVWGCLRAGGSGTPGPRAGAASLSGPKGPRGARKTLGKCLNILASAADASGIFRNF